MEIKEDGAVYVVEPKRLHYRGINEPKTTYNVRTYINVSKKISAFTY